MALHQLTHLAKSAGFAFVTVVVFCCIFCPPYWFLNWLYPNALLWKMSVAFRLASMAVKGAHGFHLILLLPFLFSLSNLAMSCICSFIRLAVVFSFGFSPSVLSHCVVPVTHTTFTDFLPSLPSILGQDFPFFFLSFANRNHFLNIPTFFLATQQPSTRNAQIPHIRSEFSSLPSFFLRRFHREAVFRFLCQSFNAFYPRPVFPCHNQSKRASASLLAFLLSNFRGIARHVRITPTCFFATPLLSVFFQSLHRNTLLPLFPPHHTTRALASPHLCIVSCTIYSVRYTHVSIRALATWTLGQLAHRVNPPVHL